MVGLATEAFCGGAAGLATAMQVDGLCLPAETSQDTDSPGVD